MSARRKRSTGRKRAWTAATKVYAGLAAVGVLIGLVLGVMQLVDRITGGGADAPPGNIDARITSVRLTTPDQPLGDYLALTRQAKSSFSGAQLRQSGFGFDVGLLIKGMRNHKLSLEWSMYERRGAADRRLPGGVYNQTAADAVPKSASHATQWPVWVPHPPHPGRFLVRFTLLDERGLPVHQRDSAVIRY